MPYRKPRTKELDEEQKGFNKKINRYRVRGENALACIKRYNCVSDVCRNTREEVKDRLMLLSCRLWNFNLKVS
jgi:hypothetical protein